MSPLSPVLSGFTELVMPKCFRIRNGSRGPSQVGRSQFGRCGPSPTCRPVPWTASRGLAELRRSWQAAGAGPRGRLQGEPGSLASLKQDVLLGCLWVGELPERGTPAGLRSRSPGSPSHCLHTVSTGSTIGPGWGWCFLKTLPGNQAAVVRAAVN